MCPRSRVTNMCIKLFIIQQLQMQSTDVCHFKQVRFVKREQDRQGSHDAPQTLQTGEAPQMSLLAPDRSSERRPNGCL
jgi:hypothetical protein